MKPNKMLPFKARFCERSFWIKYSLFTINFLVWVGGICLMVIGVWSRMQKSYLNSVDISLMTDPALFLVAVGVIMFVISIFGCLGSVREHVLLLKIFCLVIVIVFVLQVTAGIIAFVFIDRTENHIIDYMTKSIIVYRDDNDRKNTLDYIQKRFECCGSSSFADWEANVYYNCSSTSQLHCGVPISCCITRSSVACGLNTRKRGETYASKHIYTKGCTPILMSLYLDNLIIVGAIAFAVGFLELIAIILAHLLINYIVFNQLRFDSTKKKIVSAENQHRYPSTMSHKEAELTRL